MRLFDDDWFNDLDDDVEEYVVSAILLSPYKDILGERTLVSNKNGRVN